jgi:hypothetical protein
MYANIEVMPPETTKKKPHRTTNPIDMTPSANVLKSAESLIVFSPPPSTSKNNAIHANRNSIFNPTGALSISFILPDISVSGCLRELLLLMVALPIQLSANEDGALKDVNNSKKDQYPEKQIHYR